MIEKQKISAWNVLLLFVYDISVMSPLDINTEWLLSPWLSLSAFSVLSSQFFSLKVVPIYRKVIGYLYSMCCAYAVCI